MKEALQLLQQTSLRMKKEAAVEYQALQSRLSSAQVKAMAQANHGPHRHRSSMPFTDARIAPCPENHQLIPRRRRQEEIARLRAEVDSEKKHKASLQAQLGRLLKSGLHEPAGPGHRSDDSEWRAVMMEQLESHADKARRCEAAIAELGAALAAERDRAVQLQAEMRMAVIKGEALQEDADAARREKEVAEAQRDEAVQHAARMQRLADDALAETGPAPAPPPPPSRRLIRLATPPRPHRPFLCRLCLGGVGPAVPKERGAGWRGPAVPEQRGAVPEQRGWRRGGVGPAVRAAGPARPQGAPLRRTLFRVRLGWTIAYLGLGWGGQSPI